MHSRCSRYSFCGVPWLVAVRWEMATNDGDGSVPPDGWAATVVPATWWHPPMQQDVAAPGEALEGKQAGGEARARETARVRPSPGQGKGIEEQREALGRRAPRRAPSEEEIELRREKRRQREAARREKILARLESPEAEVRESGVFRLDADDPVELDALGAALRDPDARVRSEAARRLQFGDTAAAVPLLRDALADPEPTVVVEAIDSLKFLRDSSVISDLVPLLDHPAPQVRHEAQAAIRRLE